MSIPRLLSYSLPTDTDLPENKVSWTLKSDQSALLIHDMQTYFLNFWDRGSPLITQIIENTKRIRAYCKMKGIPVIYTAQTGKQSLKDRGLLNDIWGSGIIESPSQDSIVDSLKPDIDDQVLTKWRYSAFVNSPLLSILKDMGRNQLVITGVYAHIGCLITAIHAFMLDIQPFMIADAMADFNRDKHIMSLRYAADYGGKVAMTTDIVALPLSKSELRITILALLELEENDVPSDDDNLTDYGLNSVHILSLMAKWQNANPSITFLSLAKAPSINNWWQQIWNQL
jgi:bifunctional isochorismate lyase/aryl carrier protein